MFGEYIPKINLALAAVIIGCFFLPWVSIDCGSVSRVKLSGYNLTLGQIPLDQEEMRELTQRGGGNLTTDETEGGLPKGHPQYYLAFVIIAALGVILYTAQAMYQYARMKSMAVIVFGGVGLLGLIVAGLLDFGLGIPKEMSVVVQTTFQFGYYISVLSYIGIIGISGIWFKATQEMPAVELPKELQNLETQGSLVNEEGEVVLKEDPVIATFGEVTTRPAAPVTEEKPEGEKPPEVQPAQPAPPAAAPQPGVKACPSCGIAVGIYQTKCMKCGAKLKPGR